MLPERSNNVETCSVILRLVFSPAAIVCREEIGIPNGLPLIVDDRVDVALALGADGIAVVSAICVAPNPEAATRDLRGAIDHARQ